MSHLRQNVNSVPDESEELSGNEDVSFFRPEIRHIPLISNFFNKYPTASCDFSIGGIFIWKNLFDYHIALMEDTLIIKGYLPDKQLHVFFQPIGPMKFERFLFIIETYCLNNQIKGFIILNEYEMIDDISLSSFQSQDYMPEYKEYLYPIIKFIGFPGKKMEKKRNHLHYFEKNFSPYIVKPIESNDIYDLIKFTEYFGADNTATGEYEQKEIIYSLKSFSLFPYTGIMIRKDDKILGFSFGEKIGNTFIIHAEKADISYRGSYQAIASELAKYIFNLFPDTVYLNREDDMGNETLRQSKESYHPSVYIHKRCHFVR